MYDNTKPANINFNLIDINLNAITKSVFIVIWPRISGVTVFSFFLNECMSKRGHMGLKSLNIILYIYYNFFIYLLVFFLFCFCLYWGKVSRVSVSDVQQHWWVYVWLCVCFFFLICTCVCIFDLNIWRIKVKWMFIIIPHLL